MSVFFSQDNPSWLILQDWSASEWFYFARPRGCFSSCHGNPGEYARISRTSMTAWARVDEDQIDFVKFAYQSCEIQWENIVRYERFRKFDDRQMDVVNWKGEFFYDRWQQWHHQDRTCEITIVRLWRYDLVNLWNLHTVRLWNIANDLVRQSWMRRSQIFLWPSHTVRQSWMRRSRIFPWPSSLTRSILTRSTHD